MKKSKRLKNHAILVKSAAWSYIFLALLYPIFTLSSFEINLEPEGLNKFLNGLMKGGASDHVFWMFFTLLPILLIFGSIGFYSAVKPYSYKLSGLVVVFSTFAAIGFLLGIGRWATLNWGLGEAFDQYKENSEFLTSVFNSSNHILGYWIGKIFAEFSLFSAIGVMSATMLNSKRFPMWLSIYAGFIFVLGTAAIFRDTSEASLMIHNALTTFMIVPIFFIFLSIALFRFVRKSKEAKMANYTKPKTSNKKTRKNR